MNVKQAPRASDGVPSPALYRMRRMDVLSLQRKAATLKRERDLIGRRAQNQRRAGWIYKAQRLERERDHYQALIRHAMALIERKEHKENHQCQ
jgi:hypothetical protein